MPYSVRLIPGCEKKAVVIDGLSITHTAQVVPDEVVTDRIKYDSRTSVFKVETEPKRHPKPRAASTPETQGPATTGMGARSRVMFGAALTPENQEPADGESD